MANSEPPTPTLGSLARHVRAILEQELAGFDGPCDITLRADGDAPDRSVFAVARLHGCATVAIARVYEADLPHLRRGGVQVVYLSTEDAALLYASLVPRHCRRPIGNADGIRRSRPTLRTTRLAQLAGRRRRR